MPRGRPRGFDVDAALDQALRVFWRKGYAGASLPELTEAMGINRPSLYAAFGNKEALFLKALDRYSEAHAARLREATARPTAREVAERFLRGSVDAQTSPGNPPGCLVVRGTLSCGEEADPIRRELLARREAGDAALRDRFERAKVEGDLPANADPAVLARYLTTVILGLAVRAADGASREELTGVVEVALRAWPETRSGL